MNVDTGEPLDALSPDARKWAKGLGSKAKSLSEVLQTKDPIVSFESTTVSVYLEQGF